MDDATSVVLSRELAENRTLRQQGLLYQSLAGLLHEAATLAGVDWPLEPAIGLGAEPAVLARYANRLEAWLEPRRAAYAKEANARADAQVKADAEARRKADQDLLRTAGRDAEPTDEERARAHRQSLMMSVSPDLREDTPNEVDGRAAAPS